jgi:hypothetical protein
MNDKNINNKKAQRRRRPRRRGKKSKTKYTRADHIANIRALTRAGKRLATSWYENPAERPAIVHKYMNNPTSVRIPPKVKYDIRAALPTTSNLLMKNVVDSAIVECEIPHSRLCAPILSVILHAVGMGVLSEPTFDENPNYIAYAYKYACTLLTRFLNGQLADVSVIPKWLNVLFQALKATEIKFKGGMIKYRFKTDTDTGSDWQFRVSNRTGSQEYFATLGVILNAGNQRLNDIVRRVDPPSYSNYSEDLGSAALNAIAVYMSKQDTDMYELVAVHDNIFSHDSSAFATTKTTNYSGGGYSGLGGAHFLLSNEVPIKFPIFSAFNTVEALDGRVANFTRTFSGDGLYLGYSLSSILRFEQMNHKAKPIFKCIDVNEIIDVYARTLIKSIETRVGTTEGQALAQHGASEVVKKYQCPLTFWEFSLMIINTLRANIGQQIGAQGIYPEMSGNNTFVPLASGVGTIAYGDQSSMLWPAMLHTNVLALNSVQVLESRQGPLNPTFYVPVLGKIPSLDLSAAEYTFKYYEEADKDDIGTAPLFAINPNETNISLIDGKSASNFYNIGDPVLTQEYAQAFNEYLTMNLSDTLLNLGSLGADLGAASLRMLGITRHIKYRSTSVKAKKVIKRFQVATLFNNYNNLFIRETSSQGRFFSALWTELQQYFIAPIYVTDGIEDSSQYKLKFGEMSTLPNSVQTNHEEFGVSLGIIHSQLATLNIRSLYQTKTTAQLIYDRLVDQGEDSLFSIFQRVFSGVGIVTKVVKQIVDSME